MDRLGLGGRGTPGVASEGAQAGLKPGLGVRTACTAQMARGCAAQLAVCAQGGKVQQRERTSWAHLCLHETTTRSPWSPTSPSGLSPLARGNRHGCLVALAPVGPIPARTGQPRAACTRSEPCRAYPRSHGATATPPPRSPLFAGLSPLARGNPNQYLRKRLERGPIPARTGQPQVGGAVVVAGRAYPRSHGATDNALFPMRYLLGLSPLARGNRPRNLSRGFRQGPIPARTGQPTKAHFAICACGAYPRSHGATQAMPVPEDDIPGLSPLARGNQTAEAIFRDKVGPIPARTGQPAPITARKTGNRAYPRSHGATGDFFAQ